MWPSRIRIWFTRSATSRRSALTTIASSVSSNSAGPNSSVSFPTLNERQPFDRRNRSRRRFRVAYGATRLRPRLASAPSVSPMKTKSAAAKALARRASCPAWRTSKVPPMQARPTLPAMPAGWREV